MVGSAEEVAAQISAFAAMGYTDIIVRNICQEQSKALACIERLGEVKALL
jgi:alkanesulfonate monooxygenase SsuD/methylene tetrahydromethanopterin reductase-like flavin-dependent oxidoreductase (luciferase family)